MAELTQEERMIQADKELHEEVTKWDELGVNIQATIAQNAVAAEIGFKHLITVLAELLPGFDQEEFLIGWRVRTKNDLQKVREQIEPQIRSARLQASGFEVPRMDIPKNGPRKLH